jgi:FtsP/CotA-like multicopper oxidase with cupredoxin domain
MAGAAAGLACIVLPVRPRLEPEIGADGFRILSARPGSAPLRGEGAPPTPIWGYAGTVPGPTLRVRRGEELKVRLVNELPEPTTVHWHGLRLANAMDGVPHLTQHPIAPASSFDYRFRAPDAGTFWYHSHLYSSEQLERGLYGVLIVEEPASVDQQRAVVRDPAPGERAVAAAPGQCRQCAHNQSAVRSPPDPRHGHRWTARRTVHGAR